MDQFVNRIKELARLQTLYESGTAELAIIYGRRQIGKSELVRQSIGHPPEVVSRRMNSPCSAALGSNAPSRKLQTSVMTSAYSISPMSLLFSRVEPPINAGG